jgi:hypothetical protein
MRRHLASPVLILSAAFAIAQVPSPRPNETTRAAVPHKQSETARPLTTQDLTALTRCGVTNCLQFLNLTGQRKVAALVTIWFSVYWKLVGPISHY